MSVNKVIIMGRIGKDIELKRTQAGKAVASFSVACSEKYTDKQGQKHETTEWVNCTAWEKTGEMIAQYFGKGYEIYIEGKLKTDTKEENGHKTYYTKVVVSEFQFTGGSKREGSSGNNTGNGYSNNQQGYSNPYSHSQLPVDDDSMPF